jgi:hypothetical protein
MNDFAYCSRPDEGHRLNPTSSLVRKERERILRPAFCRPNGTRFHSLGAYPGLTPLRQAQGRLWAIVCRPSGAGARWFLFYSIESGIAARLEAAPFQSFHVWGTDFGEINPAECKSREGPFETRAFRMTETETVADRAY